MRTIHKFKLALTTTQKIELPVGAEILSVINQQENAVLYAKVDPKEKEIEERIINIYPTGSEPFKIESGFELNFLATLSFKVGTLIFHFFEWRKKSKK